MAACLARHVPPHARLTLALSGGLDSMVLLHALNALRPYPFDLHAVHVHHGLSPRADHWAQFCAQTCAALAIELNVHRIRIAESDPAGIEAAARRERRQIFAALDTDFLLTAHHKNDQAETLMLQLLRGAGPKGLSAMAELQRLPDWRAAQLRPLLPVTRAELGRYAQMHALDWVEDESNLDIRYRRNALRRQVMPLLDAHFPGATLTLARAAALQADAAELLDDLARLDAQAAIDGARLDCQMLAALSIPRARNLLRYFIGVQGWPMPNARRLNEALHQLLDAHPAARMRVNLGGADLHRFRGGAYLVPAQALPVQAPQAWRGEPFIALEAVGLRVVFTPTVGSGLKRALLDAGRTELRLREGRERMRLTPGGPHRTLKNLLQESAIPPWERERLPLLVCDGRLVWAAGLGVDADFRAGPGEAGVMPACVRTGNDGASGQPDLRA
ncbi:MAG: tRNA lysidine(34) synthetase TilS [Hydrogenophilales bacterium 17-61-9]|nr:MAG: tRNA lysidine(34) synthetase TilS [Hydrogenophilales bacterium 17-61-9]